MQIILFIVVSLVLAAVINIPGPAGVFLPVLCALVPTAIFSMWLGARDDQKRKSLYSLQRTADVIPVYEYEGRRYEGPVMSASDMIGMVGEDTAGSLEAMPHHKPVRQGQVYSKIHRDMMKQIDNLQRETDPRYGEPQYMPDGRWVGYRYFDRNEEGDLLSASYRGVKHIPEYNKGLNWGEGENWAHESPAEGSHAGLYAAYDPDSPTLNEYKHLPIKAAVAFDGETHFGERSGRSEHGQVIQILEDKSGPGAKPLKWYRRKD